MLCDAFFVVPQPGRGAHKLSILQVIELIRFSKESDYYGPANGHGRVDMLVMFVVENQSEHEPCELGVLHRGNIKMKQVRDPWSCRSEQISLGAGIVRKSYAYRFTGDTDSLAFIPRTGISRLIDDGQVPLTPLPLAADGLKPMTPLGDPSDNNWEPYTFCHVTVPPRQAGTASTNYLGAIEMTVSGVNYRNFADDEGAFAVDGVLKVFERLRVRDLTAPDIDEKYREKWLEHFEVIKNSVIKPAWYEVGIVTAEGGGRPTVQTPRGADVFLEQVQTSTASPCFDHLVSRSDRFTFDVSFVDVDVIEVDESTAPLSSIC